MAATVMGDRAIAMRGHEEQLVIPSVSVERPAVAEDDGLPHAPVLVKDLGAVLCGDRARAHGINSPFRINRSVNIQIQSLGTIHTDTQFLNTCWSSALIE